MKKKLGSYEVGKGERVGWSARSDENTGPLINPKEDLQIGREIFVTFNFKFTWISLGLNWKVPSAYVR